jgi:hypothetical protein
MTDARKTSTRPELGELKPGQEVIVRRSSNDTRGRDPEENYIPAVITKVARVWIELEKPGVAEWHTRRWRMRRDTQDEGSQYSGSNASFATREQHEWDMTRAWAFGVLRDNGIRLDYDSVWTGREQELADLISKGEKNDDRLGE